MGMSEEMLAQIRDIRDERDRLKAENVRLWEQGERLFDKTLELGTENARLRGGYGSMSREHSQTIVELSDAHYRIDQLKAENADLRDRLTTDAPRLPYWWTADGTLHIDAPRLPESIAVTMPDERDREVHSARVWRYVREEVDG